MATFIIQGRFSREAIQGMIARPEDRAEAVARLMESVGGRLVGYYVTFGPKDFVVIVEAPNEVDMAAVAVAVAGSGAVASLETSLAMPSAKAKEAFARAQAVTGAYRPAGKA
jgi:uncharacterized protein with GYD domain